MSSSSSESSWESREALESEYPAADDDDEWVDDPALIDVELHPRAQVVEGKPGGSRIFHEFDPGHPGGQVLVVKGRVVRVALTDKVREALSGRILREVTGRKRVTPKPVQVADIVNGMDYQEAVQKAKAEGERELAEAEAQRNGGESADRSPAPPPPAGAITGGSADGGEGGGGEGGGAPVTAKTARRR